MKAGVMHTPSGISVGGKKYLLYEFDGKFLV